MKNIDKKRIIDKRYRENHKDELAKYDHEYQIKNKAKIKEYKKQWYLARKLEKQKQVKDQSAVQ